jgi:hypothetical protein
MTQTFTHCVALGVSKMTDIEQRILENQILILRKLMMPHMYAKISEAIEDTENMIDDAKLREQYRSYDGDAK